LRRDSHNRPLGGGPRLGAAGFEPCQDPTCNADHQEDEVACEGQEA
jgi:hypothetical protein